MDVNTAVVRDWWEIQGV